MAKSYKRLKFDRDKLDVNNNKETKKSNPHSKVYMEKK